VCVCVFVCERERETGSDDVLSTTEYNFVFLRTSILDEKDVTFGALLAKV